MTQLQEYISALEKLIAFNQDAKFRELISFKE
jgi:hypothetical protein